jgi:hypothetical protein
LITAEKKRMVIFYIICMGILLLLIFFSNRKFIFDETIFVSNLPVIEQYGFSRQLFTEIRDQSPGPLYQIVHFLCKPLTQYNPPAMRMLNYLFLWIIVAFICIIMRFHGMDSAFLKALSIIVIPMTWPLAGMALSEIPSLLFCCAALVFFAYSLTSKHAIISYGYSLVGGLCLGLSVIGRSPFLVVFIPFLLFAKKDNWKKLVVFYFFASILPLYAFSIWHGIVPADMASLQSGWNISYGILGIGYLGLVTLLIAPDWYLSSSQMYHLTGAAFIIFSVLNVLFLKVTYFPLHSTILSMFGEQTSRFLSYVFPSFFVIIGLLFVIQGYKFIMLHRSNTIFIFSVLAAVLITITTVKSSAQFSSRYVAQCIPFIVMYASFFETKKYTLYYHVCGIVIGICSLASYYITN